jgi:uncharacterized membrane protein YhdT
MALKLSEKQRNAQINKEALISAGLYLLFFLWWYATGYGLAGGDPAEYTYVFGLPLWFFLSSVVGYVLFSAATIIVVKFFFKNFSLDEIAEK